jgi:hypothetical protein
MVSLKTWHLIMWSKKFSDFIEPESSLPCSQNLPLDPILSQFILVYRFTSYFYRVHFNIILTSMLGLLPPLKTHSPKSISYKYIMTVSLFTYES